jgi:hypothetical protein
VSGVFAMAIAAALTMAIGWCLVRALWPAELLLGSRSLRAMLAVGVGTGAVALLYFAALLLADGGNLVTIAVSEGVLLAGLGLVARRQQPTGNTILAPAPPPHRGLVALVVVALATALLAFVLATLADPHGSADALSIWNLRARHLFGSGPAWRLAVSAEAAHPDYPLLLPGFVARTWHYCGDATPLVPAVIAAVFGFATVGLSWAGLRSTRGARAGLLAAGALLGFPAFVATAAMQYADVPLAFFVLATLVVLVVHVHHRNTDLRLVGLAGVCLGGAVWTKNEGALFLVTLPLALVITRRSAGWRQMRRELTALALGAAPWLVAWAVLKLGLAPRNDLVGQVAAGNASDRVFDLDRYLEILRALARQAQELGPLMLAAVVVWFAVHRRARFSLPLLATALMFGGYLLVYLTASHNLSWHLATSLQRLLLHLLPAVLFAVFSAAPRE